MNILTVLTAPLMTIVATPTLFKTVTVVYIPPYLSLSGKLSSKNGGGGGTLSDMIYSSYRKLPSANKMLNLEKNLPAW